MEYMEMRHHIIDFIYTLNNYSTNISVVSTVED